MQLAPHTCRRAVSSYEEVGGKVDVGPRVTQLSHYVLIWRLSSDKLPLFLTITATRNCAAGPFIVVCAEVDMRCERPIKITELFQGDGSGSQARLGSH